jgi:prepilin-type N-terminal cleavage/methylation domain-containing protein
VQQRNAPIRITAVPGLYRVRISCDMRSPPPRTCRSRRGFTLIELLVAVLLIDVGVLAMVSGTAMIARRQVEMRTRIAAAQTAANRIQRLTAGPCIPAVGSATLERGIIERWNASLLSDAQRDIRDSVSFTLNGIERSVVVRTRVTC